MVQTNDTEIISMGVDYLTVICVFGYFGLPEMGTKGAPIATVVGQIIAMLLGLYFNLTKNTDVQFNFKSIELESYYFKEFVLLEFQQLLCSQCPASCVLESINFF